MPTRRPPWQWHQNRDTTFDEFLRGLLAERGFGAEREYYGITSEERAREVRQKFRTAGRHLQVSVKAFWSDCSGCDNGGPDCRYHVHFSAYDPEKARAYMARKSKAAGR